ncbi:hypothetical protein CNYM01_01793 [Colletotrichum nymphaeae SA-01]|uniref:Uncharacterized protein n=1 Tax=Colletotrichum nymphaeae SA-01 TaxID=1460502 RepID=A0A135RQE8_9PEZI|nr:hypothetical protein CNYM01_01793 [Colletotrichum nymphaeae SA-01]
MYVYLGKLDWKPYGLDETLVITLPNGPARAGDPVYLFSQWTKDAVRSAPKVNWFLNLIVDKVSKTASGDDVFTLKNSHYYSWEIKTSKAYGEIKVTMSNPNKAISSMNLNRIWQSENANPSGSLRIWNGKINWPDHATNELATFIVPEGFGKDKPVLAIWQWTNGITDKKSKSPNVHIAKQSTLSGPEKGVKFEYTSTYHLTFTWQQNTERLAVQMEGSNGKGQISKDLGEFALAVHYDRHSHDFNPPESAPKKAEVAHRLPQPEPSLPRILTPMPFPKGLVDTLTHAQSFIDQAGYLAKFAEQRFKALDIDLHARDHQLAAAKSEIEDLTKSRNDLINANEAEKAVLEEKLKKAENEVKQLEEEVTGLRNTITELKNAIEKGVKHDAKDHEEIESLRNARLQLKKLLNSAEVALVGAKARIENLLKDILRLEAEREDALALLKIQEKLNEDLIKKVQELTTARDGFETQAKDLQKRVADLNEAVKYFQNGENEAKENLKNEFLAKEKLQQKFEEKKAEAKREKKLLEEEIKKLKAEVKAAKKHGEDEVKAEKADTKKAKEAKNLALKEVSDWKRKLFICDTNKDLFYKALIDGNITPPKEVTSEAEAEAKSKKPKPIICY